MGKSLPTDQDLKHVKKSRKKSKQAAVTVEVSDETVPTKTPEDTTIANTSTNGVDGVDTETVFENKKALKRAIRAARIRRPADENASSRIDQTQSGKKRKDRTEDAGPSSANEPPKKKRKNRTEFADPRADTTLTAQCSKALEYAFTQMNRPSKWKFNKARQNWLIRNIWAPEILPEVYFPLVVKYLCNVQGGSKQKLIETCQSYLKAEETQEKQEAESKDTPSLTKAETEKPSTTAPLKSILKPTPGPLIAGPLIDVPPPPVASEGSEVPVTGAIAPAISALSATALGGIRRTRAQTLLDAINGG